MHACVFSEPFRVSLVEGENCLSEGLVVVVVVAAAAVVGMFGSAVAAGLY